MFGAHSNPVASLAPALGMINSVPLSRATFTIAVATPECTVPITTSTFSRADQPIHIGGGGLDLRLVVELHEEHVAAAELAALLIDQQPEAGIDESPEPGVCAGVGQHQPDLQRLALGQGRRAKRHGGGDRGDSGQHGAAR